MAYLPGSLPCFETFGNLPTDLVREDGLVEGKTASDVLDMIIIPGGSLVESNTLKEDLAREICKMADCSKFVLGICSGFQILSNGTDIGRLSAYPIMRKGLGLIDAEFTPLICTDQVKATVIEIVASQMQWVLKYPVSIATLTVTLSPTKKQNPS